MVRITTKVIRIEGESLDESGLNPNDFDDRNQSVLDEINWGQAEDAINDQLPDGFYCRVDDR